MNIKNCKLCNKEFKKQPSDSSNYWKRKSFCSKKCAGIFNQPAKKLIGRKRPASVIEKMKPTMFKSGQVAWSKGKKLPQFTNENAHTWKGDNVGYSGLHMWVRVKLGTPEICEHCSKSGLKGHQIHWANKSGEYKRDIEDWLRLCAKCHLVYDGRAVA